MQTQKSSGALLNKSEFSPFDICSGVNDMFSEEINSQFFNLILEDSILFFSFLFILLLKISGNNFNNNMKAIAIIIINKRNINSDMLLLSFFSIGFFIKLSFN